MIVLTHIAALAIGAIASYLALRNNPNVRGNLDTTADKVSSAASQVASKASDVAAEVKSKL